MFFIVKAEKSELPLIKDYGFFEKESHNEIIVEHKVNQNFVKDFIKDLIKDLNSYGVAYTPDIIGTLNGIGITMAHQRENHLPVCFKDIKIVICDEKDLTQIINWNKRNPNLFEKMTVLYIKN